MNTNNKIEDILAVNNTIIERLQDDNAELDAYGNNKYASEASTNMIRRCVRENAFARNILPEVTVQDSDLVPQLDTDEPVVYGSIEPNSPGATIVPFHDSIDTHIFSGRKFPVYFHEMSTKELTKNINELRTYKDDLRTLITDRTLNQVETDEDAHFIECIDKVVGTVGGTGMSGFQQNFDLGTSKITRQTYPFIKRYLQNFDLRTGIVLMNWNTALEFETWDALDLGDERRSKIVEGGLGSGLVEARIHGMKHLFTIKKNLVPDGVVYLFAPPQYLGKWYKLQDLTMYVKREKNVIRMSASQSFGQAIANVAGVIKLDFSISSIVDAGGV